MDLERFYRENYRIVYGYLLSLCADPAWAEDLTSEAFLKAIVKIGSYDGGRKASTWLCTIGRNLYLDQRKQRKRWVPLDSVVLREECTMEEKWIDSQLSAQIAALAKELGEPKQTVFIMRVNGSTFQEIGDALGKTENWARVTFFRVRNEILDRLEGAK